MPTITETLTQGLDHQRAGRLPQAEVIYGEILRHHPENADALHLLGILAHETGKNDAALDLIGRALALEPSLAPFHNSLGMVFHAVGQWEDARRAFETALRFDPDFPQAHVNLGNLLQDLGAPGQSIAHYDEALRRMPDAPEIHNNLGNAHLALGCLERAVECFRQALRQNPHYAAASVNLGGALLRQGHLAEAEACCREALRHRPELAEGHANLAAVLIEQRRLDEAEACCREAILLQPDFAEAWCNLGNVYNLRGSFAEAERCCREAVRHRPRRPESWSNLGNALKEQDLLDEAVECYREALRLRSDYADAHANLGAALYHEGNLQAAMESYEAALRLDSSHVDARFNRALLLLLTERLAEGWREYEWRWKRRDTPSRAFAQPAWDGSRLGGRTILVIAEQGLGDTIQFARYLSEIKQQGGRVVLECQPRLLPLLQGLPGADELIAGGSPLPAFDVHIPLLSLPRFLERPSARTPYLRVDAERVDHWRLRLSSDHTFRVGVAWAGNPNNPQDRRRSIAPESLKDLAEVPGVSLYSLQQGGTETPAWMRQIEEPGHEITDTAAIVMNLDLVISVDTMTAHLAGALGKPVWILLPFIPDWRWLLHCKDSSWYPSARLFRQDRRSNWGTVIHLLRQALERAAKQNLHNLPPDDDMKTDGDLEDIVPDMMPGS